MTSTADTADHPDVTEIADLSEGLVTPDRAQELRRHLDACTACADVRASLEEIRSLLGSAPEPEGMPDDVAARIDAALAAERTADGREDGAHVSRETAAARPVADRPAPRPGAHRPAGRAIGAATGPGRTSRTPRARRRFGMLATACTAAAVVVASALLAALQDDKKSHTAAQDRPSTSADTFSEGTLEQQVTELLGPAEQTQDAAEQTQDATEAPHGFGTSSDAGGAAGTGHPTVLKSAPTTSVPACVREGLRTSDSPLAAEKGTYAGKDAYLVVLPDLSSDAARVTAYVVDATCVRQPTAPATVLLSRSYPRP